MSQPNSEGVHAAAVERSDLGLFLRRWVARPLRVGAIAPSSAKLAKLITAEVRASMAPVLELGPGTGVFTAALLARGVAPQDLIVVERDAEFARHLRRRFPGVHVLHGCATSLDAATLPEVGAVVSGLPLRAMAADAIQAVLDGCFRRLGADGCVHQFTYGWRSPVPAFVLDSLGLRAQCTGRVWRNLPPAAVWRIERRQSVSSRP